VLQARDSYIAGRPWGICDRCGFKYRHDTLRKEWSGALVCSADYDPPPRDMYPPRLTVEGAPIPDARPDPTVVPFGFIIDEYGLPITDENLAGIEDAP